MVSKSRVHVAPHSIVERVQAGRHCVEMMTLLCECSAVDRFYDRQPIPEYPYADMIATAYIKSKPADDSSA